MTSTTLPSTVTVIDSDGVASGALTLAGGRTMLQRTTPADFSDHGTFIGPGWADLHTHVYDGMTQISIRPDRAGLDSGVHLIADAGSAGEGTLRGLVDYVLPTSRTQVRIWLNIGSHGLVHLRENADPTFMNVDATLAAIASEPNLVCGVKVRSSGAIVGAMGLQPLELARLVARESGLPLMVHIGEAPPLITEVLDRLDAGDVVTHCYHGKTGHPWLPDGRPSPALQRALDRGVLLDVGHGAASFDLTIAAAAVAAGFGPTSISTDLHVRNVSGPVHDLSTVMTKLLACGLPLPEVIAAVTTRPRQVISADDPWLDDDGTVRHATLFAVTDQAPAGRTYADAAGNEMRPERHIVPAAVIVDGAFQPLAYAASLTGAHAEHGCHSAPDRG